MGAFVGVVGYVGTKQKPKLLEREQLDLSQVEEDLRNLVGTLERATEASKLYAVEEVKVTVGVVVDAHGKVKAGLAANIAGLFTAEASGEGGKSRKSSQLLELIIRRKA